MSFEALKSAYSRYLGRKEFFLLKMTHSEWDRDWYFVDNNSDLTIDSVEYTALPFKFVLNTQGETSGSSLSIANIDQRIAQYIKLATTNEDIIANVWVCHYEDGNGIVKTEKEFKGTFIANSPSIGLEQIDLNLNLKLSLDYNLGTLRYNKVKFPNLFLR